MTDRKKIVERAARKALKLDGAKNDFTVRQILDGRADGLLRKRWAVAAEAAEAALDAAGVDVPSPTFSSLDEASSVLQTLSATMQDLGKRVRTTRRGVEVDILDWSLLLRLGKRAGNVAEWVDADPAGGPGKQA